MKNTSVVTRRNILRSGLFGAGVLAGSALIAACSQAAPPAAAPAAPAATAAPAAPAAPTNTAVPAAAAPAATATPQPAQPAQPTATVAPAAQPAPASAEKATIRWQSPYPNDKAKPAVDTLIESFQGAHPNITIAPEAKLDWDKLLATFAAKTASDIVWGCCDLLNTFILQGVAEDLTDFTKGWTDAGAFIPASYGFYTRKGHQYAIPVYCAGHVFVYNQRMFDETKTPVPTDDWTWDDMRKIAKATTKKNGNKVDYFGYDGNYQLNWDMPSLLWANGEDLWEKGNNSHVTIDSPHAMDILQWYADMRWTDKSSPSPAEQKLYTTVGFTNFQSSKAAMGYQCSWYIFFLTETNQDPWNFVAVPKGPDGKRRSWITSDAMIMYTEAKNKAAAWEVMKFGTSDEMENTYMNNGMLQPARTALQPKWLGIVKEYVTKTTPAASAANAEAYVKAFEYSPTLHPHFSDHAKAMEILQPALDQIFVTGTAKVKDVLPDAVKKVNEALKNQPSTV